MNRLFSDRALKKKHNVGDFTGPVSLISPPLKATFGVGLLIAFAGSLWAFLARIPITVEGTGVLLPVSTISSVSSEVDGITYLLYGRNPQEWHELAYKFKTSPSILSRKSVITLAKKLLNESEKDMLLVRSNVSFAELYLENLNESLIGKKLPRGKLLLWVQNSGSREKLNAAKIKFNKASSQFSLKAKNISSKQRLLENELAQRTSYLRAMQSLEAKGYVTRASILQESAQVDQLQSQIYSNRNDLINLENDVQQAYIEIRNSISQIIENELVFSNSNSYMVEIIPNHGDFVSKGDDLLRLSSDPLGIPSLVPVFLSGSDTAQVSSGMNAIATPEGYKRSEVGGIKGQISSVTKLPQGLAGITSLVGDKSLAEAIAKKSPSPSLAILSLTLDPTGKTINSGGYEWTSTENLPFSPSSGDELSVQITTRLIAPVEFVLPSLRSFFGFAPPNKSTSVRNESSK